MHALMQSYCYVLMHTVVPVKLLYAPTYYQLISLNIALLKLT